MTQCKREGPGAAGRLASLFASTADTGMVPPLSALPRMVMSGLTSSHSLHSILPVLRGQESGVGGWGVEVGVGDGVGGLG